MQCKEVRSQFAGYVTEQIEDRVRSEVLDHLRLCDDCRTEIEDLKTLWVSLDSIPAVQPGPEMRSRFDVMLKAYEHGLNQAPGIGWWQSMNSWLGRWWPRQPAMQVGFTLGVLIIGIVVGHRMEFLPDRGDRQQNTQLTELRAELSQTRQMVAISLMQQQSASERLKGVNWSYQLQQPGREVLSVLLDTLMHDSNVNVRLATVDALRQFGDQAVVRRGVIEAMGRQESAMVQIALIDLAVDLREKESVATLRQLTQDQKVNEAVRDRAQRGLSELE